MKRIYHFILLLLLLPAFSRAQGVPAPVMDSIAFVDSLSSAIVDSITSNPNEDDYDDTVAEKDESVFSPRWMSASDSVRLRHVNSSTVKAQQADEEFWYANYPFKKKKVKDPLPDEGTGESIGASPVFETILWIIVIAGFITFLVVFLTNGNAGIFRRSRTIRTEESVDESLDDIFAINYEQRIEKAAAEGNYNFAVRLLYLRLLRTLAERNIIDYQQDRTNFDYLLQLQPTKYYKEFFRLTRHYEYSWYGQFRMEQEQFDLIRRQFADFDRTLN